VSAERPRDNRGHRGRDAGQVLAAATVARAALARRLGRAGWSPPRRSPAPWCLVVPGVSPVAFPRVPAGCRNGSRHAPASSCVRVVSHDPAGPGLRVRARGGRRSPDPEW